MKRFFLTIGGVICVLGLSVAGLFFYYTLNQPKAAFWESSIAAFEEEDALAPPLEGTIIFIGSSSIRFWETLAEDFAPLTVLNRGFGGSHLPHVAHFAPRVVVPHEPAAVVVYAGDNDFGGWEPKSAEQVFTDLKGMMSFFEAELPSTPIYYLSIKPSELRWESWPKISKANVLIESFAAENDQLTYIDVSSGMIGENGKPRSELFWYDGLHLSERGYEEWTAIVRPILLNDLGGLSE
ncbi:MAG: hypothetical protein HEP70_14040 [Rhodobiaceae bacterium]|nr:hypothetical protein [Rhodobiaceae bacterium]